MRIEVFTLSHYLILHQFCVKEKNNKNQVLWQQKHLKLKITERHWGIE